MQIGGMGRSLGCGIAFWGFGALPAGDWRRAFFGAPVVVLRAVWGLSSRGAAGRAQSECPSSFLIPEAG